MRDPWNESLPVKLEQWEMLEVGQKLSQAITKRDKLEERRKHVAKLLKERVDRADSAVHEINRTMATGYEYRDVRCREEVDLFNKKIRIIRLDTYAVVKERDMEYHELQLEIRDAGQASANLARMEQQDGEGGNLFQMQFPTVAGPGAEVPPAPAGDITEEQHLASTPEEAEALREARLAVEAVEREATSPEPEAPVTRDVAANAALASAGREDLAQGQQEGDPF